MRAFADTHFVLALLNSRDARPHLATELSRRYFVPVTGHRPIVTTDWVLVEVGNAFSKQHLRPLFIKLLILLEQPAFKIVHASQAVVAIDCLLKSFLGPVDNADSLIRP